MEEEKIYNIPENYIDQGRILNGMFKTRYFVEGTVLSIAVGSIMLLLTKGKAITFRIPCIILTAGPCFILGLKGIDGYPISTTIGIYRHFKEDCRQMVFEFSHKPYKKAPIDIIDEKETAGDKLIEAYNKHQEKKIESLPDALTLNEDEIEYQRESRMQEYLLIGAEGSKVKGKELQTGSTKKITGKGKMEISIADPIEAAPDIDVEILF